MGEFLAAGYLELPGAAPIRRWSRAVRRRFEHRALPAYAGTRLFPSGHRFPAPETRAVAPDYAFTWIWNPAAMAELRASTTTPEQQQALETLGLEFRALDALFPAWETPHTVGGAGYTHSIPNYGRVLREGLNSHEKRVRRGLEQAQRLSQPDKAEFYQGLLDVLTGVRAWHARILTHLRTGAPACAGAPDANRQRLIQALEQVPFEPARSFFEAVCAYNLVYYLDDCDNPGRVDQELWPFYEADRERGRVDLETATALIRELWENCDANDGWSASIGGTTPEGTPAFNDLTLACLRTAEHMRRPNLQLRVTGDMPDRFWDAALDTLATGTGLPALHCEERFREALRQAHLGIAEADLSGINGGGCTETMIHGCSNVGSLDAGLNLPLVLCGSLQAALPGAADFDEVLDRVRQDLRDAVRDVVIAVNRNQEAKARFRPQPMRSLLIDDCIDGGVEYNAGGARYNWSVINVAGLANVADSLAAVREVVFERQEMSGAQLATLLAADYAGHEEARQRLARCPRYGNDETAADSLAHEIADCVFRELLLYAPWRGGRFLGSCLMFTTYTIAGKGVGATPDGRRAGEPLSDSAGPHQGRDRKGPTAALASVARIPHDLAPGTLVVNLRLDPDLFRSAAGRNRVRSLVETYFRLGGMQLQVNVVDQAVLEDAIAHPQNHANLIVRVGGYSEYFNRLDPELKRTVLERTRHGL
jgi:formate C-acetyltransferase